MASEPVVRELIVDPALTAYSAIQVLMRQGWTVTGMLGDLMIPSSVVGQGCAHTRPVVPACTHIALAPTVSEHSYYLYTLHIRHHTISTTHITLCHRKRERHFTDFVAAEAFRS